MSSENQSLPTALRLLVDAMLIHSEQQERFQNQL